MKVHTSGSVKIKKKLLLGLSVKAANPIKKENLKDLECYFNAFSLAEDSKRICKTTKKDRGTMKIIISFPNYLTFFCVRGRTGPLHFISGFFLQFVTPV